MSAAEGASEASSPEQANERTYERVAQYFSLYSWLFWPTVPGWLGRAGEVTAEEATVEEAEERPL